MIHVLRSYVVGPLEPFAGGLPPSWLGRATRLTRGASSWVWLRT